MQEFSYKLFKGNIFKELVKTMLEDFGYKTAPYGYENQFSTMIKTELSQNNSETSRRIRSSPDLVVYDPESKTINLVEVKMSANEYITINKLEDYHEYWDDAIMVAIINDGKNLFYAEKIRDIRSLSHRKYNTSKDDFRNLQDLFARINGEKLDEYRKIAIKIIEATGNKNIIENDDLME
jgi:hypothetical protein